jgi:hypothetical protein
VRGEVAKKAKAAQDPKKAEEKLPEEQKAHLKQAGPEVELEYLRVEFVNDLTGLFPTKLTLKLFYNTNIRGAVAQILSKVQGTEELPIDIDFFNSLSTANANDPDKRIPRDNIVWDCAPRESLGLPYITLYCNCKFRVSVTDVSTIAAKKNVTF